MSGENIGILIIAAIVGWFVGGQIFEMVFRKKPKEEVQREWIIGRITEANKTIWIADIRGYEVTTEDKGHAERFTCGEAWDIVSALGHNQWHATWVKS